MEAFGFSWLAVGPWLALGLFAFLAGFGAGRAGRAKWRSQAHSEAVKRAWHDVYVTTGRGDPRAGQTLIESLYMPEEPDDSDREAWTVLLEGASKAGRGMCYCKTTMLIGAECHVCNDSRLAV